MRFTSWEPTAASAALEGSLTGLVCFGMLCGLVWLGRWVVGFFDRRADGSTYSDEEGER